MATEAIQPRLSSVRKAAIMTVLLGPEVSAKLVRHLTPRQVARLAREVAEIGPIEPEVAERVLQDYYRDALRPRADSGGPELARHLLNTASIPEDQVAQLLGPGSSSTGDVLGTLLEAQPQTLARALQHEHPQTTALVLLHIPPSRASLILQELPETVRAEAVLRMATLRQVPGEVVGDVAASLQERLARSTGGPKREEGGYDRTADVLKRLPRVETRRLLEELEPDHPDQVAGLRDLVFTFEGLADADDPGLQELLRQVDSAKLALALYGTDEALMQRILGNLSERAGAMLKEEIEFLSQVSADEQNAARKEIVDIALQLEADGKLQFAEAPPDEEA